jgi:glycosyltransferase involved in cell wall biosynthesis
MNPDSQPLVSVLTPVYNGEKFLAECIESVLAQTYENWEYIIVNNCSTDNTLSIASAYAERDTRFRVVNNRRFLSALANHNHAFRQLSPDSKYCKMVHADDWIFSQCIEQMVEIAEQHPSVGLVGSYMLMGEKVVCDRLPYRSTMMPGPLVCRRDLLSGPGTSVFGGSPTALLIRSDLIRRKDHFYNEDRIYTDREICYELLQHSDFGFVHQVLTYARTHEEQQSAFSRRVNSFIACRLFMLTRFGRVYLQEEDYERLLAIKLKQYYGFLSRSILAGRKDKEFWDYHRRELAQAGFPLNRWELLLGMIREIGKIASDSKRMGKALGRRLGLTVPD